MLKWVAGKQKGPPGTVGPQLSMGFCYSSLKKNLAVPDGARGFFYSSLKKNLALIPYKTVFYCVMLCVVYDTTFIYNEQIGSTLIT